MVKMQHNFASSKGKNNNPNDNKIKDSRDSKRILKKSLPPKNSQRTKNKCNYSANNFKECPFGQKSNKSIQNLSNLYNFFLYGFV